MVNKTKQYSTSESDPRSYQTTKAVEKKGQKKFRGFTDMIYIYITYTPQNKTT